MATKMISGDCRWASSDASVAEQPWLITELENFMDDVDGAWSFFIGDIAEVE
jgi:hypothetical protein